MPIPFRKRRHLRPSVLSLENHYSASSLAPGILPAMMSTSGSPRSMATDRSPLAKLDQPASTSITVSAAQPRRTMETQRPLTFRPRVDPVVTTTAIDSTPLLGFTVIDARPQANGITITPSLAPSQPSNRAVQGSTSGGVGAVQTPLPNPAGAFASQDQASPSVAVVQEETLYLPGDDTTVYTYSTVRALP